RRPRRALPRAHRVVQEAEERRVRRRAAGAAGRRRGPYGGRRRARRWRLSAVAPSPAGEARMTTSMLAGPSTHHYVSQRLKLHFIDWGGAGKPALLLVHGGLDHCRNWDWLAQALRDDYHVI